MYQHPGVYIEEIPSGALTIEAASTSTAAFIGPIKRGDLVTADKDAGAPVLVTSISQFAQEFGVLNDKGGGVRDLGDDPDYFGIAVNAFFNNGGTKAYIVPVGKGDGIAAVASFADPRTPANAFYFTAASPGVWANNLVLQFQPDIEIDSAPNVIDFTKSRFKAALGLLNAKGNLDPVFETFGGMSLDPASPLFVKHVIGDGSSLVTVDYKPIAGAGGGGQTSALLGSALGGLQPSSVGASALKLTVDAVAVTVNFAGTEASVDDFATAIQTQVRAGGPYGNGRDNFLAQVTPDQRLLLISGSTVAASAVKAFGGKAAALLGLDSTAYLGKPPPNPITFPADLAAKKINIKLDNKAAPVAGIALAGSASLGDVATKIQAAVVADAANGDANFKAIVQGGALLFFIQDGDATKGVNALDTGVAAEACLAILGLDDAAGAKAARPAVLSYPATFANKMAKTTFLGGVDDTGSVADAGAKNYYGAAFDRLRDYRDISIMLLPGFNWIKAGDNSVLEEAIAHAEFMKNRLVVVDPPLPKGNDKLESATDVNALGAGDDSPFSVLYYPWLNITNPFYDKDIAPNKPKSFAVPPSAFAAGIWARIDNSRGVWKAPAGLEATVRGTLGPTLLIGNDLQDNLNEWGINCLRSIIGPTVVWGARTLASKTKPDFRYVPVRRTESMIGESLYEALQTVVFEPNDHKLWASLRASIGTFMDGLFRSGAFQGEKASDAYYVRCGLGSTMTQGDIDLGIVRVVVGFAPLKPAEFVVIQIQQIVGQPAS